MISKEPSIKKNVSHYANNFRFFDANEKEYKIPTLKLLDDMVTFFKFSNNFPDFSNTIFVGVQHILETTVTLFDALIELGVKPENMYFSGKCYSTSPVIAQQIRKRKINLMEDNKPEEIGQYEKYCRRGIAKMWAIVVNDLKNRNIDQIVVLDEGGRCLEMMPEFVRFEYKIGAIEQTRAGLYTNAVDSNQLIFPLIEVASCVVKKTLEPPLIAAAVISRLENLLLKLKPNPETTFFGIVGNGAIGNGLCKYLLSNGYKVICYDESEAAFKDISDKSFYRVETIPSVIANSNIILGCTGKDITEGLDIFSMVQKDKIFVSCTSEDKEFRSLLRKIGQDNSIDIEVLSDIVCLSKNKNKITVLQGGFPFNFDRNPWNVPAKDIEVTQGLLLGACIQAVTCATKPIHDGKTINRGTRQTLNPLIQSYVALHWLSRRPKNEYPANYHELFKILEWIQKNSGGEYYENNFLNQCFQIVSNNDHQAIQACHTSRAKL